MTEHPEKRIEREHAQSVAEEAAAERVARHFATPEALHKEVWSLTNDEPPAALWEAMVHMFWSMEDTNPVPKELDALAALRRLTHAVFDQLLQEEMRS